MTKKKRKKNSFTLQSQILVVVNVVIVVLLKIYEKFIAKKKSIKLTTMSITDLSMCEFCRRVSCIHMDTLSTLFNIIILLLPLLDTINTNVTVM